MLAREISYSAEYFRLVRRALKNDGLVLQWIGSYTQEEYLLQLRTFLSVFPETTLWGDGSLMIGTKRPFTISRAAHDLKLADPGMRSALARFTVASFDRLIGQYIAGPKELRKLAGDGPILTDDQPRVEYFLSLPLDDKAMDLSGLKGRPDEIDAAVAGPVVQQARLLNGEHPIERDLGPVLLLGRHDDPVVDLAFEQAVHDPQQVIRRHAEHRRAQAPELIERDHRALWRDFVGETIHQVDLGADGEDRILAALSRTVFRMYSVEPLSSAAWTTSHVHSGWTITRMPGCCLRTFSICFAVKRVWTEQWPFHRIIFAALASDGSRPPQSSFGSHTTISSSGTPIL